jgi:hypothetical protein
MTPGKIIQGKDIPPPFNQQPRLEEEFASMISASSYKDAKSHLEKAFLVRKLREFNGNVSQTADAIGIERSNLHKKIKAYGLDTFRSQSTAGCFPRSLPVRPWFLQRKQWVLRCKSVLDGTRSLQRATGPDSWTPCPSS